MIHDIGAVPGRHPIAEHPSGGVLQESLNQTIGCDEDSDQRAVSADAATYPATSPVAHISGFEDTLVMPVAAFTFADEAATRVRHADDVVDRASEAVADAVAEQVVSKLKETHPGIESLALADDLDNGYLYVESATGVAEGIDVCGDRAMQGFADSLGFDHLSAVEQDVRWAVERRLGKVTGDQAV